MFFFKIKCRIEFGFSKECLKIWVFQRMFENHNENIKPKHIILLLFLIKSCLYLVSNIYTLIQILKFSKKEFDKLKSKKLLIIRI